MKKLFFIAGEISGDSHGSAMIRELPEEDGITLVGLGGPKMNGISDQIENWLDDAAVLGLWEVLKKYGYFKAKMEETVARIADESPDAVVLIDYPGFNLRLAERLRREDYEGKIIFYISPQVWAWKKGRVKKMAQILDLMICIFPFEKQLYETSGLKTVFAGHPLIDSLEEVKSRTIERDEKLVALLPGSREREVSKLFPPMLEAAAILTGENSELRFVTSGATPALTRQLEEMVRAAGLTKKIEVTSNTGQEIMRQAGAGVVASGTATLEAAILGLPYCLTYKTAWLTAFMARRLIRIKYLGIVNVIADREVVRELLQEQATGPMIAAELKRFLDNPETRKDLQDQFVQITDQLGGGGANRNAAMAVMDTL